MFKKHIFSFFIILLLTIHNTWASEYVTLKDIHYYPGAITNSYQRERCTLDFYYPKNQSNFSTIVWFHGGGLTSGQKSFPAKLLPQVAAVIGR